MTPYQSQRQTPCLSFFHRDASVFVRGGSSATEYKTAHVYRLGTFHLIIKRLDAFPLQLHNHTDSDWCLCIGRFSVLPLLLRQFQEAPAPSKVGKNGTGKQVVWSRYRTKQRFFYWPAKQIKGKNRLVSKDLLSNGKRLASYPLWNYVGKISRPAFTIRG